ncbi:MAG: sigma-54 dependent transcriptional regulator, partial [Syntrophales bacterium LBB04]|nr:sigma-54 dependent transcriptional regulator [Syntrophales bacterium LBB04]
MMKQILIVDDDLSMRMALAESLQSCGFEVETAENGADALIKFQNGKFEAVVTDMRMPKMTGMDVLRGVKKISPQTPVILITAFGTVKTAVEAMKEGASEFIMKPFSLDDLEFAVKNVLVTNEDEGSVEEALTAPSEIISQDDKIMTILKLLENVAHSKSTVLINGESGTGKELFARYVYRHSSRKNMPFIAVNCAAIPHNLLESEMFGYEKGAFTGAMQRKPGKFELAHGGTLLLDEISEMDVQLQAKLLRVLQESEVDRWGGKSPIPIDVRIIATTNADLKVRIEEKTFREDLYYRLNVIPVNIPPLRERVSDINLLAEHFLKKYSQINECKKPELTGDACSFLNKYYWPGNVRELENIMERAVLVSDGLIKLEHLCLERDDLKNISITGLTYGLATKPFPSASGCIGSYTIFT